MPRGLLSFNSQVVISFGVVCFAIALCSVFFIVVSVLLFVIVSVVFCFSVFFSVVNSTRRFVS